MPYMLKGQLSRTKEMKLFLFHVHEKRDMSKIILDNKLFSAEDKNT